MVEMEHNGLIIDDLISREGGYVNHPDDKGGPTKFGITAATLGSYLGTVSPASADQVAHLSREQAKEIYWNQYIQAPGFNEIGDLGLQEVLIDPAVHSGPRTAIRWLQKALDLETDGVIGLITLAAIARSNPRNLSVQILLQRLEYIGEIISNNQRQAVFASGWIRRISELVGKRLSLG